MSSNLIFISTPYSHQDKSIQEERFELCCEMVALLLNQGKFPISPIVHGHPTTKYGVSGDWKFWKDYCYEFIKSCKEVYVGDIDGWDESQGVKEEIEMAKSLGKDIYLINHKTAEIIKQLSKSIESIDCNHVRGNIIINDDKVYAECKKCGYLY